MSPLWRAETLLHNVAYCASDSDTFVNGVSKTLRTPKRAKEIEQKTCRVNIDSDTAASLFKSIRTFDEFRDFMVCVVLGKMPSPVYKFLSVDVPNTDNHWWGDDAWEMLVEMNVRGLITHESEDNGRPKSEWVKKFQRENKVACRASVSGVMQNTQQTFDFLRKVNLEGMIAYSYPFQENKVFDAIDEYIYAKIPRTYMNDDHAASLPTLLPLRELALEGSPLEDVLRRCVAVEILDPNFGIPASESLFPAILRHLHQVEPLFPTILRHIHNMKQRSKSFKKKQRQKK